MSVRASIQDSAQDVIHGVVVRDPFRWLEDGTSIETRNWVRDQQIRYDKYCAEIRDLNTVRDKVRDYLDVEVIDQPARVGERYFFRKRQRGCEQAFIYVGNASTGEERPLVVAPELDRFASVGIHCISIDGSLLAYELKHGGDDLLAIHVIDVESGTEYPDLLEPGYARGFSFATDNTGFYYCHETASSSGDHVIQFHRFGDQSADQIIHSSRRHDTSRLVLISDDEHLGAIFIRQEDKDEIIDVAVARRGTPTLWNWITSLRGGKYKPILNNGRVLVFSFQDAPNGVLLEYDLIGRKLRVIIPQPAEAIQQLAVLGDHVIISCLRGWGAAVTIWSLSGEHVSNVDVPEDGTICFLQSLGTDTLFYSYESFGVPPTIYEINLSSGQSWLWQAYTKRIKDRSYQVRPVNVKTDDGATVPLLIVAKDNLEFNCVKTVIMTAYGGFGNSVTPQYSILANIMLELGCAFVIARIRGGREFGEGWHDAAKRDKRQRAFDDFISAAEWLCLNKITEPHKLAAIGGSNAGLLVGAAITQRPDLFGSAICISPLLDMVRYEIFNHASRWRSEYGSVENAEEFQALYSYSPYHHVHEAVDYPPVLFISGDKDDRCNPAHIRKMVARLQQRDAQSRPILLDYSGERGHCPVLPLSIRLESLARRVAFLCRTLKVAHLGERR